MDLLTLKQIATQLNAAESTCRLWRDKYAEYIPTVGSGRQRRYKKEAVDVLRYIQNATQRSLTQQQIEQDLMQQFSRIIDVSEEPQQRNATQRGNATQQNLDENMPAVTSDTLMLNTIQQVTSVLKVVADQQQRLDGQQEQIERQQQEMLALKERQERIEQSIEKRDQKLMETIRTIQENKKKSWLSKIWPF